MLSRGLRNNNPGNIRLSTTKWKGEIRPSRDAAFCTFTNVSFGYRALIKTLQTYQNKYGCKSIPDFIKRWAPANENNTIAYIKSVCSSMQISTEQTINVNDKMTMCAFAAAISKHENGISANMKDVQAGYDLI